jgi:hypothetical protein
MIGASSRCSSGGSGASISALALEFVYGRPYIGCSCSGGYMPISGASSPSPALFDVVFKRWTVFEIQLRVSDFH